MRKKFTGLTLYPCGLGVPWLSMVLLENNRKFWCGSEMALNWKALSIRNGFALAQLASEPLPVRVLF